ncbi:hypothetical protein CBR_g8623 [Chara braunii]|uniref:Uncharacterized protein n=1 Tax=Chara braunii TaxID=69332 RepID=A0A388JSA5_CHABU|nr:hypothetical protein CBR_g8623 [Chara braunii]|eukprot:GBG60602.1 hypothetical protein CBR_g8623 [Chara braunii]
MPVVLRVYEYYDSDDSLREQERIGQCQAPLLRQAGVVVVSPHAGVWGCPSPDRFRWELRCPYPEAAADLREDLDAQTEAAPAFGVACFVGVPVVGAEAAFCAGFAGHPAAVAIAGEDVAGVAPVDIARVAAAVDITGEAVVDFSAGFAAGASPGLAAVAVAGHVAAAASLSFGLGDAGESVAVVVAIPQAAGIAAGVAASAHGVALTVGVISPDVGAEHVAFVDLELGSIEAPVVAAPVPAVSAAVVAARRVGGVFAVELLLPQHHLYCV